MGLEYVIVCRICLVVVSVVQENRLDQIGCAMVCVRDMAWFVFYGFGYIGMGRGLGV